MIFALHVFLRGAKFCSFTATPSTDNSSNISQKFHAMVLSSLSTSIRIHREQFDHLSKYGNKRSIRNQTLIMRMWKTSTSSLVIINVWFLIYFFFPQFNKWSNCSLCILMGVDSELSTIAWNYRKIIAIYCHCYQWMTSRERTEILQNGYSCQMNDVTITLSRCFSYGSQKVRWPSR